MFEDGTWSPRSVAMVCPKLNGEWGSCYRGAVPKLLPDVVPKSDYIKDYVSFAPYASGSSVCKARVKWFRRFRRFQAAVLRWIKAIE